MNLSENHPNIAQKFMAHKGRVDNTKLSQEILATSET